MDRGRIKQLQSQFDRVVRLVDDDLGGKVEFWYARDLQVELGYLRWESFANAIIRAKEACSTMDIGVDDHFRDVTKMIEIGKGGLRPVDDIMLTRFACYLIAQNGDPRKEECPSKPDHSTHKLGLALTPQYAAEQNAHNLKKDGKQKEVPLEEFQEDHPICSKIAQCAINNVSNTQAKQNDEDRQKRIDKSKRLGISP